MMMKRIVLLGSAALAAIVLIMAARLVITSQQSFNWSSEREYKVAKTAVTPDSGQKLQSVSYKKVTLMRVPREHNKLILWISIEPETFVRTKMLMLARQLNKDFPDEPRIYVVIFDSEVAARNYDPAGGSYYISKQLERGEYFLDRVKGQEYINFSSQLGRPINEIAIPISGKSPFVRKRKPSR
jgi:hypothetical protein